MRSLEFFKNRNSCSFFAIFLSSITAFSYCFELLKLPGGNVTLRKKCTLDRIIKIESNLKNTQNIFFFQCSTNFFGWGGDIKDAIMAIFHNLILHCFCITYLNVLIDII